MTALQTRAGDKKKDDIVQMAMVSTLSRRPTMKAS